MLLTRASFTSNVKEFNHIQSWMNINHKCVKKEVVIWLVFLCKTLDINEIFFLTSWYAAIKSDLNACGVSTQPSHSSASLRWRKMPNLHLGGGGGGEERDRHFFYPRSLYLSPLLYHLKCTQCFTQTEKNPSHVSKSLHAVQLADTTTRHTPDSQHHN